MESTTLIEEEKMNEETNVSALVPVTMQTVQVVEKLAPVVAASRMFNVSEAQAAVVMLKGHELGLGLATAFEFIHVIDGKPGVSPKGMMALIQRSQDVEIQLRRIPEDENKPLIGYKCWMKRKSTGIEYTTRFTLDDAKRAGLIKSGGSWEKYPENMCQWRAIGFCADVVCPDLGGGMLRTEELGADITPEGETMSPEIENTTAEEAIFTMTQKTPVGTPRPWPPETVKAKLLLTSQQFSDKLIGPESPKMRGLLVGKVQEALQSNDDKVRHLITKWLWGVEGSKELVYGQVHAMLKWLVPDGKDETGDYPLDPMAVTELLSIKKQAEIDAGQQKLELQEAK